MDWQNVINIVIGSLLAVGGWFARQLWDAVQKLKTDMSQLELSISDKYVRKDDFKDGIKELKEMLSKIFDKLDSKQDR
jgi:predicted negative regulator of RcsB-dependent stress response